MPAPPPKRSLPAPSTNARSRPPARSIPALPPPSSFNTARQRALPSPPQHHLPQPPGGGAEGEGINSGQEEDKEGDGEDSDEEEGSVSGTAGPANSRYKKWKARDARFEKDVFELNASKRHAAYKHSVATILHELRRLDVRTGAVSAFWCVDPTRVNEFNLAKNPYTYNESTNTLSCKYEKESYNRHVSTAFLRLKGIPVEEDEMGTPVEVSGSDLASEFNNKFSLVAETARSTVTQLEKFKMRQAAKDLERDRQMQAKEAELQREREEKAAALAAKAAALAAAEEARQQQKEMNAQAAAMREWALANGWTGPPL